MARTVRRYYLLGFAPVTLRNFDHRKDWIEDKLRHLGAFMEIDLETFALMSNHFHLVLRSKTPAAEYVAAEPTQAEQDSIGLDPLKLAKIRSRLSDVS